MIHGTDKPVKALGRVHGKKRASSIPSGWRKVREGSSYGDFFKSLFELRPAPEIPRSSNTRRKPAFS